MEHGERTRRMPGWALCIWPGFARLWLDADIRGLFWAILFGGLLQVALVTNLVWPEIVSSQTRWLVVGSLAAIWIYSFVCTYRRLPFLLGDQHATDLDALFRQAQTEYLRRNWDQAERLLRHVLDVNDTDVDARLLFVTLLRRSGREREGLDQLQEMTRFAASDKWRFEIARENGFLRRTLEINDSKRSSKAA